MKVGVTGAAGFLGRHLVLALEAKGHEVHVIHRSSTVEQKAKSLSQVEFVYHLAGTNRPPNPEDFHVGNVGSLLEVCRMLLGRKVPIMLASSIQAELDNPYGNSKRQAEQILEEYTASEGTTGHLYRFPNLFGKWIRPDYNSAVATFCDRIARGVIYAVNDRSTIVNLNYIDDVVESLCAILGSDIGLGIHRHHVEPVYHKSLGEIVDLLEGFKLGRATQFVPMVADDFAKRLYSTYLTYVPFDEVSVGATVKHDERGWLFEFVKSSAFGQIFVSTTKPGITRGNHWHHTKVERFCLVKGNGVIRFRKIDGEQVIEVPVNESEIQIVDIPPGYTHSITNIGIEDMIVLFWANEIFDDDRPDTAFLKVLT